MTIDRPRFVWLWLLCACAALAACTTAPMTTPTPDVPTVLRVIAHDSFVVSDELKDEFMARTGVILEIIRAGDTGLMVNQVLLNKDNPQGDVLFGIDNTFLSRALVADVFLEYQSPALADVPIDFLTDARVTPIDYGDVCLNYDIADLERRQLPPPATLRDLTGERYRGLFTTMNPATSSPGLAFLLATIAVFGETGDYTYLDYWRDLRANDVSIVDDWSTAYNTSFSLRPDGTDPIIVSYASSPPAEVYFADPPTDTAPTRAVIEDHTCFRQIEYAGILRGTPNQAAAQQWIDFMLTRRFQEEMPLTMFVFPVNRQAVLPPVFQQYAQIPAQPLTLDPANIEANREGWLQRWQEVVLR
jgi:thiamine transport system substrate-binding protein